MVDNPSSQISKKASHRQIVLDTETTGLHHETDRMVEIAMVELIDRRISGRTFHRYINPECAIGAEAMQVHGLTLEFLSQHPVFERVVDELIHFIQDAELIAHHLPFDLGFIQAECRRCGRDVSFLDQQSKIDTFALAKKLYPGQRYSLDALCKRFKIDRSKRTLYHGALIDVHLLIEVYLCMTGGQTQLLTQSDLSWDSTQHAISNRTWCDSDFPYQPPSAEDIQLHEQFLKELLHGQEQIIW